MSEAVTCSVDGDAVGWIVFDDSGARANVLNAATCAALASAMTLAEREAGLRALIIVSGKDRIFIAGADLQELAALPDANAAMEFSRRGQRLFQRLAAFRVPVVCAIHGACAGGGFELALACHWRIASDADVTRIGLPETSIGTIPGWGGSVRLPRLIGAERALDHILSGQLVSSADAYASGLVNEVAAAHELGDRAKSIALHLAGQPRPKPPAPAAPAPVFFSARRESIRAKTRGHYPALLAAVDVIEEGAECPLAEALEVEAQIFGEVTTGATCKNLLHVFFLREAAKKRTLDGWFPRESDESQDRREIGPRKTTGAPPFRNPIRRVAVVGAGVMGSGIAQWLAAHGHDVVLKDVRPEIVECGLGVARGLFDDAVRRGTMSAGEANSALQRITTATGWDGFETCDLVIEAIVENTAVKQALFSELAQVVSPTTLLASNTSALPIEELAGHISRPDRTLGIHFFNPVGRMPLVELVVGRHTSGESAGRALALVKALGKSPLICRSSPGFLVTRVLFFYLNEAVRLWEQGIATEAIDGALRDYGWPMGPLRLIDEVGIDVTDSILGEMEHYFPQRFTRSTACARLRAAGLRGRKNGASRGFYRYDGRAESINEDELIPLVASRARTDDETARQGREREDVTNHLMRVMVGEAKRCVEERVVLSPDDVDFALLSGAGFPAFRGGLLHGSRASSEL